MSTTIDEKVVEMRFDNKDFAEKTKDTISLLDKLKEKLNMSTAAKSFDSINTAASKVNISSVGNAADSIKLKFSAMEVVAVTAITNITNQMLGMAQKIIDDFTLAPVTSGFKEYETQINAVQTILANTSSKGTTLDQVNAALDELNRYADLTIYNFTEMTRNIGTFTAAGVDLDTSVRAIQGIANLAAVSGSNAQQASTAMYQLSQALASGTVKLQDWNSVVNAGMGGQVFQDALKETARIHGIAIDEMIKDEGSFRETLQKGWLTSEILTETLSKFTKSGVNEYIAKNSDLTAEAIQKMREEAEATDGAATNYDKLAESIAKKSNMSKDEIKQLIQMSDTAENAATKVKTFTQLMDTLREAAQSGWTQTWELIIGNFEEAKEFYTKLSDFFSNAINKSATARNNLLEAALGAKAVSLDDWDKLEKAGVATESFVKVLKQTAKEHGVAIDEMEKSEGSFKATLKQRWLSLDILKDTMKKCSGELTTSTNDVNSKLKEFEKLAKEVIQGNWGNGAARKKALAEAGHDYEAIQMVVNHMLLGWELDMNKLSEAQIESLGLTEDQAKALKELAKQAEETGTPLNELIEKMSKPTGRELLIDSLWNTIKAIAGPIKAIKAAWDDLFTIKPDQLYNVIDGFHKFTGYLVLNDEQLGKLTRTFKGLFSILKVFAVFSSGAFGVGLKALRVIMRNMNVDILDVTARIGDFLYKCSEWINTNNYLTKGLEYFARGVKMVLSLIKQWIKAFLEIPEVKTHIDNLSESFSNGLSKIKEYLKEGKKRVEDFTQSLKNMDKISLSDFLQTLSNFKSNVFDYFTNFDGLFDKIIGKLKELKSKFTNKQFDLNGYFSSLIQKGQEYSSSFSGYTDKIVAAFDWMRNNIVSAIQSIQSVLSNVNWGAVGTILAGAGILYITKQLCKALSLIAKVFDGVGSIVSSIEGVFNALSTKIKAEALEVKSKAIRNIAISVAILAGALIALSKVPTGDLIKAGVALGGLAIGLGALGAVIGIIDTFGAFTNAAKALIGLAASVYILVKSLQKMEKLNPDTLVGNVIVLIALAGAFATIAGILGKKSPKMSEGTSALIVMAVSIRILVGALKTMDGLDTEKALASTLILVGLIFALGKASAAASSVQKGSFVNVLAAALALVVLVKAIKGIMTIKVEKVMENLDGFIVVFGMFAALMLISRLAGQNAKSAGVGILAMSVGINLIVHAMKQIGKMSKSSINKSVGVIMQLFVVFGAVTALSKFAGEHAMKAGVMILAMSGAMLAIALVMATLSKIPKQGLDQAVGAIVKMEACFAALVVISRFAGKAENVKSTIIVLTAAIAVMAIAVGTLSMIDPSRLAGATAAISILIGMFSLLAVSTKFMGTAKGTLIVMTAAVAVLAGILYVLAGLPVKDVLGVAASLSILLLSLSASTLILSAVGQTGPAALIGLGSMSAVIAGIAAFMAAAGALREYFPELEELIDNGIPLLNKVADGIGQFVGNIVGGFLKGATDGLSDVADNLSDFMSHLQPFIDGVSNVDESSTVGATNIAKTILALTAADVLNGLTKWLTGGSSLTDFAEQLEPFGEAMAAYSNAVSGKIDEDAVVASTNAGKALAELANELPNSGGALGLFLGNNDMATIGPQLKDFGKALADYSAAVAGKVDAEAVESSANAAQAIAELASNLPNSGGALGLFLGNNDVDIFGKKLPDFGKALADYSAAVAGKVDAESVESSANAAKAVAGLANELPNSGGLLSKFFGETNMSTFGTQLEAFGQSIANYSEKVGNINPEIIDSSTSAAKALLALDKDLPDVKGPFGRLFGGTMNMDTFGHQLEAFGQSMSTYSGSVSGIDSGIATTTSNIAKAIQSLQDVVPEGEKGIFSRSNTLSDVGQSLVSFGREFSSFYDSISGISPDAISAVTTEMKNLVSMAQTMEGLNTGAVANFASALTAVGNAGVNGLLNAFTGAFGKAQTVGSEFVQRAINGVRSRQAQMIQAFNQIVQLSMNALRSRANGFTSIGQLFAVKMAQGVRGNAYRISNAIASAARSAASSAGSYYNSFYNAGYYMASGFAAGISSGAYKAKTAARAMAKAADQAARNALGIHSPSKVMYQVGSYTAMGFIKALNDNVKNVYSAGTGMAESAENGVSKAVAMIGTLLSDDLNIQPVIAPVVDMSNATAGLQAVDSLFNTSPNVRLGKITADLNARVSRLDIRDRNAQISNAEIVDAIDRLESAMYGMQVVMDTGATVGALKNGMDQRLGMRSSYRDRWN